MSAKLTNFGETTLAEYLAVGGLSLKIQSTDTALFPTLGGSDWCFLTLWDGELDPEIVKVTAISGDTFTILRAQESSSSQAWMAGTGIRLALTAGQAQQALADIVSQDARITALETAGSSTSRVLLAANRTYYVRTDGSNSNTGLANTAGGAFLTIQKALDVIATLDLAGYTVTIQVADGTYAGQFTMYGRMTGQFTVEQVMIQGNAATPANVIMSYNSADGVAKAQQAGLFYIKDMKFNAAGANPYDLFSSGNSLIRYSNIVFGTAALHCYARDGGAIECMGSYSITAGATAHWRAEHGGRIRVTSGITCTLTGTPAFSVGFVQGTSAGTFELVGITFSGSATGARYVLSANAVVNTNGAGATYLPGNTAGSTATGGQYA